MEKGPGRARSKARRKEGRFEKDKAPPATSKTKVESVAQNTVVESSTQDRSENHKITSSTQRKPKETYLNRSKLTRKNSRYIVKCPSGCRQPCGFSRNRPEEWSAHIPVVDPQKTLLHSEGHLAAGEESDMDNFIHRHLEELADKASKLNKRIHMMEQSPDLYMGQLASQSDIRYYTEPGDLGFHQRARTLRHRRAPVDKDIYENNACASQSSHGERRRNLNARRRFRSTKVCSYQRNHGVYLTPDIAEVHTPRHHVEDMMVMWEDLMGKLHQVLGKVSDKYSSFKEQLRMQKAELNEVKKMLQECLARYKAIDRDINTISSQMEITRSVRQSLNYNCRSKNNTHRPQIDPSDSHCSRNRHISKTYDDPDIRLQVHPEDETPTPFGKTFIVNQSPFMRVRLATEPYSNADNRAASDLRSPRDASPSTSCSSCLERLCASRRRHALTPQRDRVRRSPYRRMIEFLEKARANRRRRRPLNWGPKKEHQTPVKDTDLEVPVNPCSSQQKYK